jgi:hypothetical protein
MVTPGGGCACWDCDAAAIDVTGEMGSTVAKEKRMWM